MTPTLRLLLGSALVLFVLMAAGTARAHTPEAQTEWKAQWAAEVLEAGGITPELLDTYRDFTSRHPIRANVHLIPPLEVTRQPAPAVPQPPPAGAEQWRPLIAAYFPPEHIDAALRVLYCESRGNPQATHPSSGAAGLFQAMPQWFTGRGFTTPSPYGPFDPYNPEANVAFAAWLSAGGSDWTPWVCRP